MRVLPLKWLVAAALLVLPVVGSLLYRPSDAAMSLSVPVTSAQLHAVLMPTTATAAPVPRMNVQRLAEAQLIATDVIAPIVLSVKDTKASVGIETQIIADTKGKKVQWQSLDPLLRIIPPDTTEKQVWAIAGKPGRYTVQAWTAIGDDPTPAAKVIVTVGDVAPDTPIGPIIPPGPNVADLVRKFQVAYTAEPALPKKGQLQNLTGLYTAMIEFAGNKDITTTGLLLGTLKKTADSMLVPDVLMEIRRAISTEITDAIGAPSADTPLDDTRRAKAVDTFRRISLALSKVVP